MLLPRDRDGGRRRAGKRYPKPFECRRHQSFSFSCCRGSLVEVEDDVRSQPLQPIKKWSRTAICPEPFDVEASALQDILDEGDSTENLVLRFSIGMVGREHRLVVKDDNPGG